MTVRPGCREAVAAELRSAGCVWAEAEADVLLASTDDPGTLATWVGRRAAGEPLEHVVGWARFHGRRVVVGPGVFVPRRRSEFLADVALAMARASPSVRVVVELCCGVAAIATVLASELPGVRVLACDVDPRAVDCARRNLAPFGGEAYVGDLAAALPPDLLGGVDLLVANAPYVPTAELAGLPGEARDHEPRVALDGGPDGLGVQRRVAAQAVDLLVPGGHALVETGLHQAAATRAVLTAAGLRAHVRTSAALAVAVVVGTRE